MEKKMPLPSFTETFNMPSKILARFKDIPNLDDDLSDSDIYLNKCSCCWASELLNSRMPSPIWNDTNFRIVSELTGLTSRIPECLFTNNSLECQEYEEEVMEAIDDIKEVGSSEQICSLNNKEKSPSKYNKQDDVTDTRYPFLCMKSCNNLKNENFGYEHQCKSSKKNVCYDGMPSCIQLCGGTKKAECAAEISDSGSNGDMTSFSGYSSDSGDGMLNSNKMEKPLHDINAHGAVPDKIDSSVQKRYRREVNAFNKTNQENLKASISKSLKNDIQQPSDFKTKRGGKAAEKHVADYRTNQPAGIISEFSCDKCQRTYKSKKTLRLHRNKYPDCKPPLKTIRKKKSYAKQSVHLSTLEDSVKKSESDIGELLNKKDVTTNKERLKKNSASIDDSIKDSSKGDNKVGPKFCSILSKNLAVKSKNSCIDSKISTKLEDPKNSLYQCDLCVKCYKHKSSLQKHKKKSHPLG